MTGEENIKIIEMNYTTTLLTNKLVEMQPGRFGNLWCKKKKRTLQKPHHTECDKMGNN